jgi:3-methyladenine DNA glycosylase/8-oxoguanine DNA glycosylase
LNLQEATALLVASDPVMAALVDQHGVAHGIKRRRRPGTGRFEHLAESIAYQQLAGKAAAAIWGRVRAAVAGEFTPEAVLAAGYDRLRAAGFSNAKALSVLDLAAKVAGGTVRLDRIGGRADDEVIAELTQVRGIGTWTAEMFLIFTLDRLDVWPVGDLAVRVGYGRAYGLAEAPTAKELAGLGERFRPVRTLAAWYCWRTVVP